jgi:hypothetical protein
MNSLAHFTFKERPTQKNLEKEDSFSLLTEKKEFLLNGFNKKKYFLINKDSLPKNPKGD